MNWKDYEQEIYEYFKSQFPDADVSHNVFIEGRYSKAKRQIDILVEDYVAGNRIRIIVDGKFFSDKIDVKEVEMFIGMLNDCEAHKGILITQEGFSQAAINRACNDPSDIELDILNFKEYKQFQGPGGIIYSGIQGAIVPPPFGWIIDGARRPNMLATLYQRGLTLEAAEKNKEWMYVQIIGKNEKTKNLDELLKFQEEYTLTDFPSAKISYLKTMKRNDITTCLRVIDIDTYPTKEYTGFVEFSAFILFCVLFTPDEMKKKNIRKLELLMLEVMPLKVNQ